LLGIRGDFDSLLGGAPKAVDSFYLGHCCFIYMELYARVPANVFTLTEEIHEMLPGRVRLAWPIDWSSRSLDTTD
jgi:hypothetical protein